VQTGRTDTAREVRVITAARGLRQFAYGLLGVTLAVALTNEGLSPTAIGLLVSVSLAGDLASTLLIGRYADAWGRRRTLTVLAVLMAATGLIFGIARWYPLLLVAAFFGTLGTTASETAPFLPIEQAMLGQIGNAEGGAGRFARYNLVASLAGALGALAAGLPDLLSRRGVALEGSLRLIFALYAIAALAVVALIARLSPAVEAPVGTSTVTKARRLIPHLPRSRRVVLQLSGLFAVDAFAGGLVTQTLMALYFHLRFGLSLGLLGSLFFGANLLAALSFLAAPALARRFGLLNTMVFTHLPSNVLLLLVPLMPTFPLAAVTLLLRQTLSQLDVPTRQAYTMALVDPTERTAAASVTSIARSGGSATSPVIAGALLRGPLLALGLPFLLAGTLKAAYDLALWAVFRRVRLPDAGT
jgi:MFS family permease